MNNLPFSNKIALVTGSGRGIGRAIALYFAQNGADVVVNYFRNRVPAEETAHEVEKLGRRALPVKADVGSISDLTLLFEKVTGEFGGLDIFIHNAASESAIWGAAGRPVDGEAWGRIHRQRFERRVDARPA